MPDQIPAELAGVLRRFDDSVADLRTHVLRASERQVPDIPAPDPKQLEEAAGRKDAPAELRAVAKAVAEGRTTWNAVANGRHGHVPEVRALLGAAGPGIKAKLDEAEAEAAAPPEPSAPAQPRRRPDDDDDFSQREYLR